MSDVGGVAEGPGSVGGVDGTTSEGGLSAEDAANIEAAAAAASFAEVDAQVDQVVGAPEDVDGFEVAALAPGVGRDEAPPGAPRGASEGTLAEIDRRSDEAAVAATLAATGPRGPSEGTLAEVDRRGEAALPDLSGFFDPTWSDPGRRSEDSPEVEAAVEPGAKRGPTEGTLAELDRREVEAINFLADFLASRSKTAAEAIAAFRAAGGQFQSVTRGGYFDDRREDPVIALPKGPPLGQLQVLAHELGHFDYRSYPDRAVARPGNPTGISDRQIEHRREAEFIETNTNRQLANEGHATLFSQQIRDEVQASTGLNIGVIGGPFPTVTGTPTEQRNALGNYYASSVRTGLTDQDYRSYYNEGWRDVYAREYLR